MINLDSMVRGEDQAFRVTFMDAGTQSPIDITGWTVHIGFGRSRNDLAGLAEIQATASASQGIAGQVPLILSGNVIAEFRSPFVIIDLSVDTGSGKRVPVLLAQAPVHNVSDYRQTYLQGSGYNNQLASSTPTIVKGDAQNVQGITLNLNNNLDPTFDIGVLVRFNQFDPTEIAYLESIREEVRLKHSQIMGAQ